MEWSNLPKPTIDTPQVPFQDLLSERKSRRSFAAISDGQLAELLWWSQRRRLFHECNVDLSKGPIPTAGSIASVRTIVVSKANPPWIYDARRHRAGFLKATQTQSTKLLDVANDFMPLGDGCLLLFFAFREYVEHYYRNPESLVLREAGVLLGVMALLSEMLKLAFCPLGTQAHDWSAEMLGLGKELVVPGGAALVGAR